MHCLRPFCTVALLIGVLPLVAQYPPGTTYPPGTYPPTYPPGTTYPDGYPTNRYPARIPGGPTVGIPIPEIKLPRRGGKDKPQATPKSTQTRSAPAETALRSVNGTLRRLSEKELLLEVEKHGVLRFRVLAKTRFTDGKGEPMRDSLLKPGDTVSAQFNPIDEETILVVRFVRAGSPEERTAAARPVDPASVRAPEGLADDSATSAVATAGPPSEFPGEPPPVLRRRSDPDAITDAVMPKSDGTIEAAREQAAGINEALPNFLVQQHTTRYVSFSKPPVWQAMDLVSAEVAYVNGSEEYRSIAINGKPAPRDPSKTGSWSTGEFAATLQDILSPMTGAAFTRRGEQTIGGRTALVYDLLVPRSRSHWRIIGPDGKTYLPAYKGTIWIDRETSHVLKVEQYSISLPDDCPWENATWVVEYDAVRLDNGRHMLPVRAENSMCSRENPQCSRNEIVFRNYRLFAAESDIKYDKFRTALD